MRFWNPQVQHTAALAWFNIDLIQPSISLFFSRTLGSSWKLLWTCFFLAGHASIAPPAPLLSGGMSPCVFQACCFTSAFTLLGKPKGQTYATPKFRQKPSAGDTSCRCQKCHRHGQCDRCLWGGRNQALSFRGGGFLTAQNRCQDVPAVCCHPVTGTISGVFVLP